MGKVIFLASKGGSTMNTIFKVADYFLSLKEPITNKKLQKLCYYAQAWHLALIKRDLFNEEIEAWVHGPVCPVLYDKYKIHGWNLLPKVSFERKTIASDSLGLLDAVYESYGGFTGDQLEELSHSEKPWITARIGLEEYTPSHNVISKDIMKEYYWSRYESSQQD